MHEWLSRVALKQRKYLVAKDKKVEPIWHGTPLGYDSTHVLAFEKIHMEPH